MRAFPRLEAIHLLVVFSAEEDGLPRPLRDLPMTGLEGQ
jgi:hypothetical protein